MTDASLIHIYTCLTKCPKINEEYVLPTEADPEFSSIYHVKQSTTKNRDNSIPRQIKQLTIMTGGESLGVEPVLVEDPCLSNVGLGGGEGRKSADDFC